MNRRGLGFFSISTIFILLFIVIILAQAQNQKDFSTKDLDKSLSYLNWENHSLTNKLSNYTNGNYYHDVIIEGVFKYVDFLGWVIFEITKMAARFAYENPNLINFKVLLLLIVLFLISPFIYPLFLIIISLILIFKEWLINRREQQAREKRKSK